MCELCLNGVPGITEGLAVVKALLPVLVSSAVIYVAKRKLDKKQIK